MPSPLQQVTQAAQRKREAGESYRDAVVAARDTSTVREIAQAAGVTRQAVYKVLNREEKSQ